MKQHLALVLLCFIGLSPLNADDSIPPDSKIGGAPPGEQRMLLNPMDDAGSVATGAWKMNGLYVKPAESVAPKIGWTALKMGANEAEQGGAKGDFRVRENVPGEPRLIGAWIGLSDNSNATSVGIQVNDAQGESLIAVVPAEWSGWKWVEVNLGDARQSYPQDDKNKTVDFPLKSVHLVWFTREAGPTSIVADGLVALTPSSSVGRSDVATELSVSELPSTGAGLSATACITNFSDRPAHVKIDYSLQQDPALYSRPLPDPIFGSDHAAGSRSWLVVDGDTVEDNRSTDGKAWTAAATPWQREHFTEALQFVDLGRVREIKRLTWLSGDANHSWFVDVLASEDGREFRPAPDLSNVDHNKKWGSHEFPLKRPFKARVLQFRFRTAGSREDLIAFPSELGVYDGAEDETVELPKVGPLVEEGHASVDVPGRSFAVQNLTFTKPLKSGAHLLGLSFEHSGSRELTYRHVFSHLREQPELMGDDSRIGMNAAQADIAPQLRELGVGSIRFENGKWPFVSSQPHQYSFTGEVAPWQLNMDRIFQAYHGAGFNVLTYMFLTPSWASTAPTGCPESMKLAFPPKDPAWYGEFCFQMAARYGSKQHPESDLLTPDKRSGLKLVKYYELWNEPNLNPSPAATWGGWAAPMDKYYEMMRFGAEAVKRADPDAVVTTAGYAGASRDVVDPLRTYQYPDGKHPIDFVDVLSVHFYSGQEPPETCKTDGNAKVTGDATFSENLRDLAEWRDQFAPGKPIWMTETGYDSAGPFGTTEAIQAARLPRVVMLCLAQNIEKVFVYRESGSTPSMHACSGVLRDDLSRKPAWYTLGTAIRQLHGVRGGARRLPHPNPDVWLMEWDAGAKPLLTAWTVDGTAALGIELGGCAVTDSFGGITTPEKTSSLQVTPYPQYLRDFASSEPLAKLHAEYDKQESVRKARLQQIASLHKYLFDFGSTENVGRCSIEGQQTDYLPVLHTTVWNDERGYGFDKEAMQDDDQPWMGAQKLDRDGTRVRDHVFRFRVQPGTYDLAMSVVPFGDQRQVIINGVDGGPLSPTVRKKDPVQHLKVKATGAAPVISIQLENDYGHFRWISCIESLESR
jgi:hypothetical protein